ncbi:hypothetical protein K502DRAFT_360393 [Neoconidiobolus thromboides FSU 785]|nr:hypothetical protein K502DRAFT_360393 [Neoconidiobolus thromboides FSU 785]
MYNFVFILIILLHNIYCQLLPDVPPEKLNFVDYAPLYSTEKDKCIIADNSAPIPGLLLNKPYTGKCKDYKADFLRIQLPGNTFPMCSFDPNWVISNLPGYSLASSYWYPIEQSVLDVELPKCIDKLKSLDKTLKVFGNTTEIKATKKSILDTLNTDFPDRTINNLLSDFSITTSCVGTNLQGCVHMWEKLLEKKDKSIAT